MSPPTELPWWAAEQTYSPGKQENAPELTLGLFPTKLKAFLATLLHSFSVTNSLVHRASWQKVVSDWSVAHRCFTVWCARNDRWEFRFKLSFHSLSVTSGAFNDSLFDLNLLFLGVLFREIWELLFQGGQDKCCYKLHWRMVHHSHFFSLLHQLLSVLSKMAA